MPWKDRFWILKGNEVNSNHKVPEILKGILEANEDWLMERILMYAGKQGYTAYTSTLKEAWRLSISGLSASLMEGLCRYSNAPEMTPEEDFSGDPISRFGIIEARRHKENLAPGSQYYCISKDRQTDLEKIFNPEKTAINPEYMGGIQLFEFLPWLKDEVEQFHQKNLESMMFEKAIHHIDQDLIVRVKLSKNLDISGKFDGTIIILEDITSLRNALANVKQLSGLLPICSHCKKIRDDKGYWNQIEVYIDQHSEATFSHGICQECAKKHYPDFDLYKET